MLIHWLGNTLWTLGNLKCSLAYRRARRDPRGAQERILFSFLRRNATSSYGRKYGYAKIRSVAEFQETVPIVTYDDLAPWIDRISCGERNVLTTEPVLLLEKSGGSSGAVKYIPYTASLLCEFRRAVGAWMADLFTHRPALLGGAQYWSITPIARPKERTAGGLPVGFADDTEYLSVLDRRLLGTVLAVPPRLARLTDFEQSRRESLKYLVRCPNLRFISVWNPSFLTLLVKDLPGGLSPHEVWPHLRVISCWTSGVSSRFLPELRELFPNAEVQGKGLLATEGVISFPLFAPPTVASSSSDGSSRCSSECSSGCWSPALAITSHFLEFVSGGGRIHLADELRVGERYSVLITTGGGFARYDLGDEVEVTAPGRIEFVGKRGCSSDVCGEKLSESFVGTVIEDAAKRFDLSELAMVAPEWGTPPRYVLFSESERVEDAARFVEKRLRESFHYDYCRRLGQLAPLEGARISNGGQRYLRACVGLGQRAGDVKPAYLRREFGWRERMAESESASPPRSHPREGSRRGAPARNVQCDGR